METKPIMKPPRDEIWFRKIYLDLLKNRQITTIFRPGERLCNSNKGFCNGEILKIRIIDKVGADWADLHGQTVPDFELKVQVWDTKVCALGSLTQDDFKGSSPDIHNVISLVFHLGAVYNLTPAELNEKSLITKTTFIYL